MKSDMIPEVHLSSKWHDPDQRRTRHASILVPLGVLNKLCKLLAGRAKLAVWFAYMGWLGWLGCLGWLNRLRWLARLGELGWLI